MHDWKEDFLGPGSEHILYQQCHNHVVGEGELVLKHGREGLGWLSCHCVVIQLRGPIYWKGKETGSVMLVSAPSAICQNCSWLNLERALAIPLSTLGMCCG